jgi:hypothetical protein
MWPGRYHDTMRQSSRFFAPASIAFSLLISTAVAINGCGRVSPTATAEVKARHLVKTTLEKLLERSNDDAFVVITASGRFVQFAGSATEPIVLDLPFQAFRPEEVQRVREMLSTVAPGRTVTESSSGFNVSFGRDVLPAVDAAMRVFHEIYQLPGGLEVSIEEH